MIDHLLVRPQAHCQRSRPFSKQRAKWVFVFFAAMRELPKFQRLDRQSQSRRFAEDLLVIPKQL